MTRLETALATTTGLLAGFVIGYALACKGFADLREEQRGDAAPDPFDTPTSGGWR